MQDLVYASVTSKNFGRAYMWHSLEMHDDVGGYDCIFLIAVFTM